MNSTPRPSSDPLRRRRAAGDLALAALIFVAGVALYGRTLAPTVVTVFDDSPEMQLVCYLLGVAHPTGYPLYTLLGKLFTLLPWGDVAYRINLFAAVSAALALAFLALLVRELTGRPLAGALAALALAVSPVFWSQATLGEVYSLHALFIVVCLWLLARWEGAGGTQPRRLVLLAAAAGLALTHHRMILLFAPALALVAFLVWRRWPAGESLVPPAWPRLGRLLPALLLPLLLYLYIPLIGARVGSLDGTYRNTLGGFLEHVLALSYGAFISGNPFGETRDLLFYGTLWLAQFGVAGGLLGLAGLLWPTRRRRMQLALILSAGINVAFALLYRVADIEVFLLPAFVLWAVGIGLALGSVLDLGRRAVWARPVALLLALAFAIQPALIAARTWPAADRSRSWSVHDEALDALAQPLPQGATIIGILGEMTVLRYFQRTQGVRPDVQTIAANLEDARMAALAETMDREGAAYLTRRLPGAEARFHLDAAGPLIRVSPKTPPAAAGPCPAGEIVAGLCLRGFSTDMQQRHAMTLLRLHLDWQALRDDLPDMRFSARLSMPAGQPGARVVAQEDSRPAHETYPTDGWQAGEVVADSMDLTIPPGTPAGPCDLILVAYAPADGHELGRLLLGQVTLPGAAAMPATDELRIPVLDGRDWDGRLTLLGYAPVGGTYPPGAAIPVELLWRARRPLEDDWSLRLRLEKDGAAGRATTLTLPASLGAGGLARQWAEVPTPANLADGEYTLYLSAERAGATRRLGPAGLPLWPGPSKVALGRVIIQGRPRAFVAPAVAHRLDATFGETIALLGWEMEPAAPRAGETVSVRLVWKALASAETSYAVFVHLVDGSGQIVAQQDSPPGLGMLPTSGWVAGEVVDDRHPLTLPAGRYTLRVGLYAPADGARLPARGATAGPDFVVLGEVNVP
jgi:hypothetical protein